MKIDLPEQVRHIIRILDQAGYEAYAVGGCVRDSLLFKTPADWDITTNARPEEIKNCFRRTVDTGIAHGTVTVMMGSGSYEITTYRIDGAYTDARHPESVAFTSALSEDLRRRDFTINAMAYNDEKGLVDLFGGIEDLENRLVRAVGVPEERFSEDALRIMRCVRFSAQLGFAIEEKTYEAARKAAPSLARISKERIRDELFKTLMSSHPQHAALFDDIGAMPYIFPDFGKKREERLEMLGKMPEDKLLRAAAFLYGLSGNEAEEILRTLKCDNDTISRTAAILRFSEKEITGEDKVLRHLLYEFGTGDIERHMIFAGKQELIPRIRTILKRGDCISLDQLAVSGKDLIEMGIKPGRGMGLILKALMEQVLDDPSLNTREQLKTLVSGMS